MIPYITYNQIVNDVRTNLWRIPQDIDLIVAIPRSGLLPATIISEYLNVNVITIQKFVEIVENNEDFSSAYNHGGRFVYSPKEVKNILVVDDTVFGAFQKAKWLNKFYSEEPFTKFSYIFLTVYREGNGAEDYIHSLVDIRSLAKQSDFKIVLYEWNIFNHEGLVHMMAFDLDGVICVDPPDERNTEQYQEYLKNPLPYHIPKTKDKPTTIITYRLKKYREDTNNFLSSVGLNNSNLIMFDADTYEERSATPPYVYKAHAYAANPNLRLYIESNDFEAQKICEISHKSVYCVETNKMYNFFFNKSKFNKDE